MSGNKVNIIAACVVALPTIVPDALSLGTQFPIATFIAGLLIFVFGLVARRFFPGSQLPDPIIIRLTGISLAVISFMFLQFRDVTDDQMTMTSKVFADLRRGLEDVEVTAERAAVAAEKAEENSRRHRQEDQDRYDNEKNYLDGGMVGLDVVRQFPGVIDDTSVYEDRATPEMQILFQDLNPDTLPTVGQFDLVLETGRARSFAYHLIIVSEDGVLGFDKGEISTQGESGGFRVMPRSISLRQEVWQAKEIFSCYYLSENGMSDILRGDVYRQDFGPYNLDIYFADGRKREYTRKLIFSVSMGEGLSPELRKICDEYRGAR